MLGKCESREGACRLKTPVYEHTTPARCIVARNKRPSLSFLLITPLLSVSIQTYNVATNAGSRRQQQQRDPRTSLAYHLERVRVAPIGRLLRDIELLPGEQLRFPHPVDVRIVNEAVGVWVVVGTMHHQLCSEQVLMAQREEKRVGQRACLERNAKATESCS